MAYKNVMLTLVTSVTLILFSCKSASENKRSTNENLTVISIDSVEKTFVIKARNNSRVYKIVAKKGNAANRNCQIIEKGQVYNLTLVPVNGTFELPAHVDALEFNGQSIDLEEDSKFEIYEATNLEGRCIKK